MNISTLLSLLRVHQYVKNLFLFLPLFFGLKIMELDLVANTIFAFIAFSLAASTVYIINDYFDIEDDKKHPTKKLRPLASGAVGRNQAFITIFMLLAISFAILIWLSTAALMIVMAYVVMNVAYSLYLKHIPIIDVTTIAIGFVMRLFVGSAVTGVPLSMWIVMMTFLLALFLALAKRRDDILIFMETGKKMRKNIDGYNQQFLDSAMTIMASVVIVAYAIYTTSAEVVERVHNEYIYLTTLFVIIGILRYLQITFVLKQSGSPSKIVLKDRFIQVTLLAWCGSFVWLLY